MAGIRGRMVYRDRRWAHVRQAALARAGWRCRACGGVGRLEVHHRRPLASGGAAFEPANLEVRCRRCHFAAHRPVKRDDPARRAWLALVHDLTEGAITA